MDSLWCVCLLALCGLSYGQNGQAFCRSAVQCYQDAETVDAKCRRLQDTAASRPANLTRCKAELANKTIELREKEHQHRQLVIDCLNRRIGQAVRTGPEQTCRAAIDQYENGKGNVAGDGGNQQLTIQACNDRFNEKRTQCDNIAQCCSEPNFCNQKYELSDLHDRVHQTKLDILELRRQCQ